MQLAPTATLAERRQQSRFLILLVQLVPILPPLRLGVLDKHRISLTRRVVKAKVYGTPR